MFWYHHCIAQIVFKYENIYISLLKTYSTDCRKYISLPKIYSHCRKYISLIVENIFHCWKHISLPKIFSQPKIYFTAENIVTATSETDNEALFCETKEARLEQQKEKKVVKHCDANHCCLRDESTGKNVKHWNTIGFQKQIEIQS